MCMCTYVYVCLLVCMCGCMGVWVYDIVVQHVDGKLVLIPICRLTIINEIYCHPSGYLLVLV